MTVAASAVLEYAVYLLGRDARITDWPNQWVRRPDFRLPTSTDDAVAALRTSHTQAPAERVEIACGAVMSGVGPADAIDWVRATHHSRAVENRRQRRWVEDVAATRLR